MNAVLALQDRLRTDVFTSIGNIDAYIDNQHAQLLNRIVQSIEFVRQRVKDKNDKYYITWPGSSSARVSKWKPDYNFKRHQPEGT